MRLSRKGTLLALVFPLVALLALTGFKAVKRHLGTELIIPIRGYDPRDLLSGHYLVYRLHFVETICHPRRPDRGPVFLCVTQQGKTVTTREVHSPTPSDRDDCTAILKGQCRRGDFVAGVERFYIPEQHSRLLDRIVRGWGDAKGRSRLVISVDHKGSAVVKELLIDDKPLRRFLAEQGSVAR